jgi:zinc protease
MMMQREGAGPVSPIRSAARNHRDRAKGRPMAVRKKIGTVLFLSIVLAGAWLVGAQQQPPQPPAPTIPLDQPVPFDSRITVGYLPNGLRYYIRANSRPVQRAELRLVVNVGSVVEDSDQVGLAHFVEHMAFNGSEHFEKQDLIRFMESIGMRLGPGVNADTSFDETVYMLHVPTDNAEAMSKAFLFLADVAHALTFDPAAIDKERGVIVEEWRQGRGASARMQDQQFPILLKGSRYGERVPIGTKENIETFKPEVLKRFYKDWYRPDLMAVIAVGDFDKRDVEGLIKKNFAPIPDPVKPRPRPTFPVPDHADTLYAIATDPEATMTTVGVYNMLPLREQVTVGAYRQMQIERIYTSMLNSRFEELTLKPNPPFIRAGAQRGLFVRSKEAATAMALVTNEGVEHGLDALVTELARAAQFGFTPGELEREKLSSQRLYESAYAERDKEDSADLAAEYIRNFTQQEPVPGIAYEYALVQRFVPGVTLDDVNKVAKDWAAGSRVVLVNAPQKAGLAVPDAARLAAVIASAARKDIRPYVDVAAGQSLLDKPPGPGTVVKTAARAEHGVIEWELSNGAKVVLVPTRFKQDEVMFRATSPGGTSLASDQDYVPAMTAAQVIGAGGVGKFDVIQLRNILSSKAVSVSAFIDDTDEGLAGGASPKDLETMFQLIYLTFTQPRADPAVFDVLKQQMKAMLANQQSSPDWVFRQTLRAALAQNHIRARPMTPEMVDQMDLQKSFAFYKERFADASDFTFVFVGAFDITVVRPLVEQYLASLPSLHRHDTWKDVGMAPPKGVVEKTVRQGIEPKSQADIVFTGPFTSDLQHEVVLDALGAVLEQRLRERLREALGGTYGVQVDAHAEKIPVDRYSITIDFGCDPARTEELVKSMFREIESLKSGGPTEEQVNDAREGLLRQHETDLAQNGHLVAEIAARIEDGADISEFYDLPREYQKLTAGAIQEAARRYLDTGNYVRVTLFPEKAQKDPLSAPVGRRPAA